MFDFTFSHAKRRVIDKIISFLELKNYHVKIELQTWWKDASYPHETYTCYLILVCWYEARKIFRSPQHLDLDEFQDMVISSLVLSWSKPDFQTFSRVSILSSKWEQVDKYIWKSNLLLYCNKNGRPDAFKHRYIFNTQELHKAVSLFVYISNAYVAERLWSSQKAKYYFQNERWKTLVLLSMIGGLICHQLLFNLINF